jgi:hypothetical protein
MDIHNIGLNSFEPCVGVKNNKEVDKDREWREDL